jgi:hypothetical protein
MGAIAGLVAAASRTVTMVVNVVKHFFGAEGGIVPQGFAEGGISSRVTHRQVIPFANGGGYDPKEYDGHRLTPMSATQPRIVSPNTWRVIGDRAAGDEAFIPLVPGSASSQALLEMSAARMGRQLVPQGVALTPHAMAPLAAGGFSAADLAALRTGSMPPIVVRSGFDVAELRSIVGAIQGLRGDLHLSGQWAPQMVDELRGLSHRLLSSVSATARAAANRDLAAIGAWG